MNGRWLLSVLMPILVGSVMAAPGLGRLGSVLSPGETGGTLIPWESRTMISNVIYPCAEEGFNIHPTNCSRFYRCVDFSNGDKIFSRFQFECQANNIFHPGLGVCLPGDCSKGQVIIIDPIPPVPTEPETIPDSPPIFPPDYPDMGGSSMGEYPIGGPPGILSDQPMTETPVDENSAVEMPIEIPIEESPVEEIPVDMAPVAEVPVAETIQEVSVDGAPVDEAPIEGAPVVDGALEETPVVQPLIEETPVEEMTTFSPEVEEAPVVEAGVEERPVVEPVAEEGPVEEIPVVESTVDETAAVEPVVDEIPAVEPTAEETPVVEPTVEETPVVEPTVEETPIVEPVTEELPVEETPVVEPVAEEGPGEEIPIVEPVAEEGPVEEMPVVEPVTEEMPVEETPVVEPEAEGPPVEEAAVEESPAIDSTVEETPAVNPEVEVVPEIQVGVEELPIEEVPIEGAPGEETPVEGTPVIDETPVEGAAVDGAVVEEIPTEKQCYGLYEQHHTFCNVFHRCGTTDRIFMCEQGTAFCNTHQMCRLTAQDEGLCIGKEIFTGSRANLRSFGDWEEFGVIELFKPPVQNSQIYGFIDIAGMSKSELISAGYYGNKRPSSPTKNRVDLSIKPLNPLSQENYFQYVTPKDSPLRTPQNPAFPSFVHRKRPAISTYSNTRDDGFKFNPYYTPFRDFTNKYVFKRPSVSYAFGNVNPLFRSPFDGVRQEFTPNFFRQNSFVSPPLKSFGFRDVSNRPQPFIFISNLGGNSPFSQTRTSFTNRNPYDYSQGQDNRKAGFFTGLMPAGQFRDFLNRGQVSSTRTPSVNPWSIRRSEENFIKFLDTNSEFQPKTKIADSDEAVYVGQGEGMVKSKFRNEYDDSIFDYKNQEKVNLDNEIKDFKNSWFENYEDRGNTPGFRDALDDIYKKDKLSDHDLSLIRNYVTNMQMRDPGFSYQGERDGINIFNPQNSAKVASKDFQQFQQDLFDEYLYAMQDPQARYDMEEFLNSPFYSEIEKSIIHDPTIMDKYTPFVNIFGSPSKSTDKNSRTPVEYDSRIKDKFTPYVNIFGAPSKSTDKNSRTPVEYDSRIKEKFTPYVNIFGAPSKPVEKTGRKPVNNDARPAFKPLPLDPFAGDVNPDVISEVFDSYKNLFGGKKSKTEYSDGILEFKDRLNHGAFAIPLTKDDVNNIDKESILAAVPMSRDILDTMREDEFIYAILRK